MAVSSCYKAHGVEGMQETHREVTCPIKDRAEAKRDPALPILDEIRSERREAASCNRSRDDLGTSAGVSPPCFYLNGSAKQTNDAEPLLQNHAHDAKHR